METVHEIAGWKAEWSNPEALWQLTPPWYHEPVTTVADLIAARQVIEFAEKVRRSTDTGPTLREVWGRLRSHTWSPTIPELCTACGLKSVDVLVSCPGPL